jgi:hypothetical protein
VEPFSPSGEGAAGRKFAYAEADIPDVLVEQWSTEHRRRAKKHAELGDGFVYCELRQ